MHLYKASSSPFLKGTSSLNQILKKCNTWRTLYNYIILTFITDTISTDFTGYDSPLITQYSKCVFNCIHDNPIGET